MIRIIFIALISYFLVIFQKSFFNFHFFSIPFLILIFLLIAIALENRKAFNPYLGIGDAEWVAIFGGFFSDIFSSGIIGLRVLILLSVSFFLKFVFKKYGMAPSFKQKRLF